MPSTFVDDEIASQSQVWRLAAAMAPSVAASLPSPGERVAVVGCGTSWFMAMSYAVLREQAGHGLTDAFAGSEYPGRGMAGGRRYDRVIAISRSGTTTEIIDLLSVLPEPTTLITATVESPGARVASQTISIPFAEEHSVVQTRFATSALTLLRAHEGESVESFAEDAERALEVPLDDLLDADQCTFIGMGWCVGLASEAALKAREAAQFWSESYPSMDYRHGPISISQPGRLVWSLGPAPAGLSDEVAASGGTFVSHDLDPQAGLVVAQRFAVAVAKRRGLDPDNPRSLTRSVILA